MNIYKTRRDSLNRMWNRVATRVNQHFQLVYIASTDGVKPGVYYFQADKSFLEFKKGQTLAQFDQLESFIHVADSLLKQEKEYIPQ